ncbi:hypothetical protein AALP_AA4G208800 [Arabis alpina]|nr:hypothetical protein AALP_AA4G208800 [Arabis alpina]
MAAQENAQAENLTADVETNPTGGQEGGVQDQPIVNGEISDVPQEKLKKSRRSKKPPKVPVSDGVIPSSEAGASASGTALKQNEESHSSQRKKKRSRRSSSVGRVPSPVRAVLTDGISESVIDDSKTAAWFANIQYHGNDGPLPAELVADPDFGLMSRHGSGHFAAANRLARKLYDRGALSRKSCSGAQTRLGIEMDHWKSVESELILREAPDSFDAEAAKVEAWLPNVAGGDVEFDSLFAGLDSDLVISPISFDSSCAAQDNVSLETLAADVGVRAFDGSMTDELGVNHDDDEYVNIDD